MAYWEQTSYASIILNHQLRNESESIKSNIYRVTRGNRSPLIAKVTGTMSIKNLIKK